MMESAQPPERLLKECRSIIDERAKPAELGNILAVSQVLASLRYNDRWLFNFFGGKEAVIESPYLKEIFDEQMAKRMHRAIIKLLTMRFGAPTPDVVISLEKITNDDELDSLNFWAGSCPDFDSFRQKLPK